MRAAVPLLLLLACAREVDVSAPPPPCHVGESRTCYDGPRGTSGVGLCREGTQRCAPDGRWGRCLGAVLPAPEAACDHQDNDCNGVVDDGVVYELDPASVEERQEALPMGEVLVAREGARVVAAWSVGISSASWTEQLRLVALSTELVGSRFPVDAETLWTDQPPINTRDVLLSPRGDGEIEIAVHAAMPTFGCTDRRPALPTRDCGELFFRHDGRSATAAPPTFVPPGGGSYRAVLAGDRVLLPEQVDGGVSLRLLAARGLSDLNERRSLPLRSDETVLRGLRVGERIVWVSSFGGTLQRVETDLRGAVTTVHAPYALHPVAVSLTALVRVRDTLWAAASTPDGMKICRWPLANPAQISVLDAGVLSDATLSYAADADQVYLCGAAFGTTAVQRFTTGGRPLPHPRPAALQVDTNTRCAVAATARGAVVFTRRHHDGVVSWGRYGCPVPRAPQ